MPKHMDYPERFEQKFITEPNSGCWLWEGGVQKTGYGAFKFNGRQECAHRASWMLHRGPIPDSLCVLHKCDNRQCVNPDHLFLGSAKDNSLDMVKKGRAVNPTWARGEGNGGGGKLTELDVKRIRLMDGPHKDISKMFGVTRSLISAIKRGDIWKSVA